MHVLHLCLGAVGTGVLDGDALATRLVLIVVRGNDLSVVLRSKDGIALGLDVYAMVDLRLAAVQRILALAVRRGDKHERVSLHGHTIATFWEVHAGAFQIGNLRRSVALLVPLFHLSHNHLVITLKVIALDDTDNSAHIAWVGSIAARLDASHPTRVVIGREVLRVLLIAACHENFGMVLIALAYIVVLLELLIGTVIVGKDIVAVVGSLYAKMVVGCGSYIALSVCRLDDALGERHGGRDAIAAHLLHGIPCVLIDILLS